jgi:putative ABC transport system permease protein
MEEHLLCVQKVFIYSCARGTINGNDWTDGGAIMDLYTVAISNLRRRKMKTLLVAFGLIVGVSATVALLGIVRGMRLELGDRLDELGANIVILPHSEGANLDYGGVHSVDVAFNTEMLTEDDLPTIDTIPERKNIYMIQPKLVGTAEADGRKALLVGADTRQEFSMKPWLSLAQRLPGSDPALAGLPDNGVYLGAGAAILLEKQAGDDLLINNERFRVFGILTRTGAQEDGLIFMRLPTAQRLLGRPGELTMIEIAAHCNFCPVEEMVMQLSDVLPNARVTALRQAALIRAETIDRFYAFGLVLCGIILFVAALSVMVTTLTSVSERTREIGIFRSIGFRSSHIASIILLETVMVSFFAGVMGYLAGIALAGLFGPYLVGMDISITWQTDVLGLALLMSTGLAALSSLYPAIKAARLNPAEALRFM